MKHDEIVRKFRNKKEQVKTAKGRTNASTNWLRRHINDPYVNLAKERGYISRAAFKLLEIDQKYNIISSAQAIVDIGAAPGGWLQVLSQKKKSSSKVAAIDLLSINIDLPECYFIQGSFLDLSIQKKILDHLIIKPTLILSDMATSSSGSRSLDHLRNTDLVSAVIEFADANLVQKGNLIFKFIRGSEEQDILSICKTLFKKVKVFKPQSSYSDSAEIYVICLNKVNI